MLNAVKPVHINLSAVNAGAIAGDTLGIYDYEVVPAGGNLALKVTVPGMGAGPNTTWSGGSGAASTGSRSPGRRATFFHLKNVDATNNLQVSFDNGNNFFTIGAGETFTASLMFRFFYLRASAGTPSMECIVGINQT
tara:strand:- start:587 stop:997 length:411 start_codon:yes stop_codon:yes gene_type:complete